MWATTVKALAIHGAEEAGPYDGPDYMFGWGVLNTRRSAEIFSWNDNYRILEEHNLLEGDTDAYELEVNEQQDIRFTLVWNDPPFEPREEELDDRTPNLINDLNIVVSKDGKEWNAWKLDPDQPERAATQGVNTVDNVERIDIYNAEPGTYTVTVSHSGDLKDGLQSYSLIGSYIFPDASTYEYVSNEPDSKPGGHGPGSQHNNDNDDDDDVVDNRPDNRPGGGTSRPGSERPGDEELSLDAINYVDGYWDIVEETAILRRGETTYGEIWVSVDNTGSRDIEVTVEFQIGYFCPANGDADYELSEVTFTVPGNGTFEEVYNYEIDHRTARCGPDVYLNDMWAEFK